MTLSKNPAFNLKAVLHETGIAADTLRAWERRYGLPLPQRTAGGHRSYSQYDIETIKWLLARQAEGLSISKAVDSWNEKTASGTDPLDGFTPQVLTTPTQPVVYLPPDTSLESLRSHWLTACLDFNEADAEQALNQAFAMYPVETLCTEVLQRGLSDIGTEWYENRASVQQEHFASSLAMRRLDTLLSASPAPTRNETILVGCPANEWHSFTPLLFSLFLRRRGLNVIYLGANVPATRFEETVKAVHANLVILVAQTLTSAATLQLTALTLSGLRVPVACGGRIFNLRTNLMEYIPGYYLGDTIESSFEKVELLLKGGIRPSPLKTASQKHLAARQAFTSWRTHIEGTIKELVQPLSISPEDLNTGLQSLGDNIAAALQLGDMDHVTDEIEWLKDLLQSHQRPPQELVDFMNNYSRAVDKHIDGQGEPIKTWLNMQNKQ
jgi:MerR family transcriptional regulator, light-induced transcriptional regulator